MHLQYICGKCKCAVLATKCRVACGSAAPSTEIRMFRCCTAARPAAKSACNYKCTRLHTISVATTLRFCMFAVVIVVSTHANDFRHAVICRLPPASSSHHALNSLSVTWPPSCSNLAYCCCMLQAAFCLRPLHSSMARCICVCLWLIYCLVACQHAVL